MLSDPRCDRCNEPEVLPENVEAIALFLRCTSQWRFDPTGFPSGLEYRGLRDVAELVGIELTAELFERIQVLESEWIAAMHDRAKRSANG